jgi:hypothetical protein
MSMGFFHPYSTLLQFVKSRLKPKGRPLPSIFGSRAEVDKGNRKKATLMTHSSHDFGSSAPPPSPPPRLLADPDMYKLYMSLTSLLLFLFVVYVQYVQYGMSRYKILAHCS